MKQGTIYAKVYPVGIQPIKGIILNLFISESCHFLNILFFLFFLPVICHKKRILSSILKAVSVLQYDRIFMPPKELRVAY